MAASVGIRLGGWCRVELGDPQQPAPLELMVRFHATETGRVAIAEIVASASPGVTSDALRVIPIGQLEAWANGPHAEGLRGEIERRAMADGATRAEFDCHRGEANHRVEAVSSAEATLEQVALDLMVPPALSPPSHQDPPVALGRGRLPSLRLRVPDGQPKPDGFYEHVARLYSMLSERGPRPAVALAEANGVAVTQVHGWIKEARRRGLLAPGERAKRTSR